MKSLSPKNYFEGKISHGFVSLYTGKTIIMISSGLLGIFLPIFIYNLFGQNFLYTAIYFIAGYWLYVLTAFFGARFLNKLGFRRALRISVFLGAFYYAIFYFTNENNFIKLIPLILITITLYRILYWLPYHVDFAKFTSKKNRGKQISAMRATRETLGVFIPLVAGFIISKYGFSVLFITAIILYLVSGIPYTTIPRTREKFSWTYKQTFKKLFSKEHKKQMIAFISDGAETSIALVVWPIFIFQLLKGNYLEIGALSTFIIAFSVAAQLILGKKLDKNSSKKRVLKFGSIMSSIAWLIKIFIVTAFHVFLIGAFHNLIRIFARIPFDALTYETAANEGHYVDEFTVLHEIAINTGKGLSLVLAAAMSLFLPLQWVFIIAALACVTLNYLKPNHEKIVE